MPNNSGLIAAIQCKCPVCRKGKLFPHSAYSGKFYKINEKCPHCGHDLRVEPGFYIGAMYVNYAFTVAQVIGIGVLLNLLMDDVSIITILTAILTSTIVFLPVTFRLSKSLYLYWFSGLKYKA